MNSQELTLNSSDSNPSYHYRLPQHRRYRLVQQCLFSTTHVPSTNLWEDLQLFQHQIHLHRLPINFRSRFYHLCYCSIFRRIYCWSCRRRPRCRFLIFWWYDNHRLLCSTEPHFYIPIPVLKHECYRQYDWSAPWGDFHNQ